MDLKARVADLRHQLESNQDPRLQQRLANAEQQLEQEKSEATMMLQHRNDKPTIYHALRSAEHGENGRRRRNIVRQGGSSETQRLYPDTRVNLDRIFIDPPNPSSAEPGDRIRRTRPQASSSSRKNTNIRINLDRRDGRGD